MNSDGIMAVRIVYPSEREGIHLEEHLNEVLKQLQTNQNITIVDIKYQLVESGDSAMIIYLSKEKS